jgi:trehalose 6-phosphate phosphatase
MSSRPTALEALARDPARSGLVLDFDGVLAPIVEDAAASAMPDEVAAILSRLARRLGLLAVVSGRPAAFLADRVRVPGVPLLGSYGMEQVRDGVRQIDPEASRWLGAVREATRGVRELLAGAPGVRVEEKSVSVAVHWRQAPDRDAAAAEVRRVTEHVAAETGLQLEPGKLVEELRPPVAVNKGTAVTALLAGQGAAGQGAAGQGAAGQGVAGRELATVAYVGDDLGDIPALCAVREAGGYALVVDHGSETDPRLLELADETYAGTKGFAAWLAELADAVGG